MLEKIIILALVIHFLMEAFVVVGMIGIRRKIKKTTSLTSTLRGVGEGVAIGLLAVVLILFTRWIGWIDLSETLITLAVPYVLFAIFLVSNNMTNQSIRQDAEESTNR